MNSGNINGRKLRKFATIFSRTPLHPQWLMPSRRIDARILNSQGTVLDIGAADNWVKFALPAGVHYVSLDYPATGAKLYGAEPDVFGDACSLPFADASICAIVCYEVLEHVKYPERALLEISRVLTPGGVAHLSAPFLYPVHDAPHDYQRWTRYGWHFRAADAGLCVDEIEETNHSLHSAATLVALALAGPLVGMRLRQQFWRLPIVAVLILCINISAWLLAKVWPSWGALTSTHRVFLRKSAAPNSQ